MPPTVRFNRDAVLNAAFELIRREGPAAFNARAVARELGGSTQPIFRLFESMEELYQTVIIMVRDSFCADMHQRMDGAANPYLALTKGYLLFARQEPQLFKLLFMRDRVSDGFYIQEVDNYDVLHERIASSMHISLEQAKALHFRTWIYTHGLAVTLATKYIPCLSDEEIDDLLNECCTAAIRQLNIPLSAQ